MIPGRSERKTSDLAVVNPETERLNDSGLIRENLGFAGPNASFGRGSGFLSTRAEVRNRGWHQKASRSGFLGGDKIDGKAKEDFSEPQSRDRTKKHS